MKQFIIPALAAVALVAGCAAQPAPAPYYRTYQEATPAPINLAPTAAQAHHDAYWVSIQQRLQAKGYYRGQIDGQDGPETRAAVMRYQHDLGVPVTGRVGDREWSALGLSSGSNPAARA